MTYADPYTYSAYRRPVRCPVCLVEFQLHEATELVDANNLPQPDRIAGENEDARRDRLERVQRVCPGAAGPGTPGSHRLPYRYDDPDPIVLGVIGTRATGKSHLLAAMVHRLISAQTTDQLGIRVTPVDQIRHQTYIQRTVQPFVRDRLAIPATQVSDIFEPVDILEIHDARGRRHTLVLFDVDGESLQTPQVDVRFLVVANALIFVADPETIKPLSISGRGGTTGDLAFDTVTDRILAARDTRASRFTHIPTAVVVAKADLLRYRGSMLANKWMTTRTSAAEEFDGGTVREESEDVWCYLSRFGGEAWLAPARRFAPVTLHFASAAGTGVNSEQRDGRPVFNEAGFRHIRVLKPLLALLHAHGVALMPRMGGAR